jgi:hypothetical protein
MQGCVLLELVFFCMQEGTLLYMQANIGFGK